MTESNSSSLSRRSLVKNLSIGAGVALAGCTGGGNSGGDRQLGGGDGDTATDQSNSSGAGATKEVLFWEYTFPNDDSPPIWKDAFKENYNARGDAPLTIGRFSYEDLRQKFLTGARTGDPDVIEGVLAHLTEYIKAGHLEPLDDRVEELDYFDGFVDSALDAMRYQGKLYGLPYMGNGRALIYRMDILEELGQEPPETAQEFQEIGRLINKEVDGVQAYHNCTKDGSVRAFQEWMSHVYQHTDQLYVLEGDAWALNIDADTLGQIFDNWYYQVWAADEPLGNPDQLGTGWQVNDPGYLNGQFAFIECGTWLRSWTTGTNINDTEATTTLLNENTGVGHLPYGDSGSRGTFLEVKPIMMNSHSEQKDAAWDVIATFASPDTMNAMGEDAPGNAMTPVHDEVESTIDNENWEPFVDVFETGRALAKVGWGPVREPFYRLMQEVSYGKTDPYKAGTQLHEELTALESEL
ncbi:MULTISPECIES: extracellular solute-binding protein [unclassified Haloferax]|uniref:extracellular solute-binding protein n=1 Tax=unclassified Haloferax TaxID=2625095 RepID=UPI001EF9D209|nr:MULTISPECIES: extracellular solute-binding protein [unclassified Haloferax]